MSVVKPKRCRGVSRYAPTVDNVPLPSQEFPQHAIGPWTIWAASAMGWSTIIAPSKAQDSPPLDRQTLFRSSVAQPSFVSLSTFVIIAYPSLIRKFGSHNPSSPPLILRGGINLSQGYSPPYS